jgi:5,10-methylenetetrahydromethanopterin reductase
MGHSAGLTFDMLVFPSQDPRGAVDLVRDFEPHGFETAWLGDSPPLAWGDVYATLALCSAATSRLRLGPGVTNPLTRHVSVTANAMVTLHHLSGGRAALGIGTGDSALRALGLQPASLTTVAESIALVRQVFAERGVKIPVYMAVSGPRALRMAGRIADGAIVAVGTHPSLVARSLEHIAEGAREASRKPEDVDAVFLGGLAIESTWEAAKWEAAPMTARRAKDAHYHPDFFFPPELEHLRSDAERVSRSYDYHGHMDAAAPHARLVTDELVDAYTLAGTPDRCAAKLRAMQAAGVRHVVLVPTGHDRRGALERFVASVLPRFR